MGTVDDQGVLPIGLFSDDVNFGTQTTIQPETTGPTEGRPRWLPMAPDLVRAGVDSLKELFVNGTLNQINADLKLAPIPLLDIKGVGEKIYKHTGVDAFSAYGVDVRYNETSNLTSIYVANNHPDVFSAYHFPTCYNSLDPDVQFATCHMPTIIFFVVMFAIICLISISGNFLVLYVVSKSTRLHRPPSVFKASLAVADLLISLLVLPTLIYNIATRILAKGTDAVPQFSELTRENNGIMPSWWTRMVGSATLISSTASILTLLVMAIDRLVATRWPIYHRIHNSNTRAALSISIVWIISIIPTLFLNIYEHVDFQLQPYTMTFGPSFYTNLDSSSSSPVEFNTTTEDSIWLPFNSTSIIDETITADGESNSLPLVSYYQNPHQVPMKVFGILYTLLCWLFPWLLTTVLTLGVGVYGWKSLRSIRTIGGHSTVRQKNSNSSVSSLDSSSDGRQPIDQKRVLRHKRSDKNEDSSKRLVKTLSILVAMYSLCTLPMGVLQIYVWGASSNTLIIGGDVFRWIWFSASCLFLLQSSLNIFIYHRSKEFSDSMRAVFSSKSRDSLFSSSTRNTHAINSATNSTSNNSKRKLHAAQTLSTTDGGRLSGVITRISTQQLVSAIQKSPLPPSTPLGGKVGGKQDQDQLYDEPSTAVSTVSTSVNQVDSGMDTVSTNSSDIV